MSAMNDQLSLADWLDRLRAELGGADRPELQLAPEEQRALLLLSRIAAHRSERIAAPLSSFLAGVALAQLPPAERAKRLDEITAALEEPTADTEAPPAG